LMAWSAGLGDVGRGTGDAGLRVPHDAGPTRVRARRPIWRGPLPPEPTSSAPRSWVRRLPVLEDRCLARAAKARGAVGRAWAGAR
jgi:hypothetical protein